MPDPAAFLHDAPQLVRGRVATHDVEGAARPGVLQSRVQRRLAILDQLYFVDGNFGIFEAHSQFFGLVAAAHHVEDIGCQVFDVYIPEPGEVFAVNDGVAGGQQQVLLTGVFGDQAQHEVEGGRILDEGQVDGLVAGLNLL